VTSVADVVAYLEDRYPPGWAEAWDRVGLVVGEPEAPAGRVLCVVDCVPETVDEALALGADLIVAHHPLLLRGVSSVATTDAKGRVVHRLIRAGVALFVAHTNADVAAPGVSDALADRLGLVDLRPLAAGSGGAQAEPGSGGSEYSPRGAGSAAAGGAGPDGGGRGIGRIGTLPVPTTLAGLAALAADRLPPTSWGVRAAGDPDRPVRSVAVCGGSGDAFLTDARRAAVDAYLTADLRHHVASEYLAEGGPALLDAAHWATERPWLDRVAAQLSTELGLPAVASDLDTDPWTLHVASSQLPQLAKEPSS
jgi:dinuclear metal center YbgI/SA1388 family protein